MIKTVPLSGEEVFSRIPEGQPIGILGCGNCAAVLGTGGTKQVDQWAGKFVSRNPVVFSSVVEAPCDQRVLGRFIGFIPDFDKATHVLMLVCQAGIQSLADYFHREKKSQVLVGGLRESGLGWLGSGNRWGIACTSCSLCTYDPVNGPCPVAPCPLRKSDGPCQNRLEDDLCPIQPHLSCSWISTSKAR